jgi:hypothetical protein
MAHGVGLELYRKAHRFQSLFCGGIYVSVCVYMCAYACVYVYMYMSVWETHRFQSLFCVGIYVSAHIYSYMNVQMLCMYSRKCAQTI